MSMQSCKGDGSCLEQTDYRNAYKKFNDISCTHDCQPIKCPNYSVCEHLEPQWILWCYKGTCPICASSFGHLQFQENTECPVCLEIKPCVKGLKCNHYTCIDCFKRCHLPPYWNDPQPQFPYDSELEDEYDSQREDPRWRNDPLIQKYEEDLDKWEDDRNEREESESYLKLCPMCRQ